MNEVKENSLLLLPIKDLNGLKFKIGGYQRGYKWGKREILELLNDIHSYDQRSGLYCLQPLIVKPLEGEKKTVSNHTLNLINEVIDGQQRTTTLHLLLRYLSYNEWIDSNHLFEVDYRTRERSGIFLKEDLNSIFKISMESISKEEINKQEYHDLKSVNALWKSFIKDNSRYDNVDVYHFFVVTCYLVRWIEITLISDKKRKEFIDKLLESVKVIWYSLNKSENDEEIIKIFLNNNKGRIGLTSSELIKALFILNIKNNETAAISNIKINQFASEWDSIEKQLQKDAFWYFIQPNEKKYKQGTRIDYLFDLVLEKGKHHDDFYSYRFFERKFNSNENLDEFWDSLNELYYKLLNWFEDSEVFHFVGFLTNSKFKTLDVILKECEGLKRDDLKGELKKIIKNQFSKKRKGEDDKQIFIYRLETLNYIDSYKEILNVLMLYNVLYYLNNMAGHKFPFELFIKEDWSIEHIIPQNPKGIDDINIYYQWVKDVMEYAELKDDDNKVDKILNFDNVEKLLKDDGMRFFIDKIILESEGSTHDINNLLLLDRNSNSILGNKLFKEKRVKILELNNKEPIDAKKTLFIPAETLNAFNKTFAEKINIENWTKEDGDNYFTTIQERLKSYLPEAN